MSQYEVWSIAIAAIQSVVLIVVLVVYARQLRSMQELPQESIIEADAKLFEGLLKAAETFLTHQRGEAYASFRSNDCGPIILDHCCSVSILHSQNRQANALL
jgi:hypothetical protein